MIAVNNAINESLKTRLTAGMTIDVFDHVPVEEGPSGAGPTPLAYPFAVIGESGVSREIARGVVEGVAFITIVSDYEGAKEVNDLARQAIAAIRQDPGADAYDGAKIRVLSVTLDGVTRTPDQEPKMLRRALLRVTYLATE